MSDENEKGRMEAIEEQLERLGMSFSTIKDGKLLYITKAMLVRLLERVERKGVDRVVILIQDLPEKSKRS